MQKTVTIKLDTGILQLEVEPGHIPLQRLLGFAARVSSKRKFLLVSKVLGKHYPVSPKTMSWSYRALARLVLKKGVGESSLWIGMAETATGLGYGVFEAACHAGVQQALFMQTTRYHLDKTDRLEFEEAHSHATDFFLYYPEYPEYRKQFLNAETLVLIDDEISTGKTFLRLIKAYQVINPALRKVFIVSLVNFAHPDDRAALESQAGVAVEWVCFRQGLLHFEDSQNAVIDNITVNVSGNGRCKKHLLAWPGRLGLTAPISLDTDVLEQLCHSGFNSESRDIRPILVLGTGECNAPAYLLGRELESKGFAVKVQSTTRSPIHQGNDIALVCQFEDNYEDGIANFIYNVNPDDYREIILCHETPLDKSLMDRLHAWQAISARFELKQPNLNHAKLHFFRP
ncbi:phosphoribosyltransferase domain-containing protein [Methylobacter sp. S3L5C]|uniref:phosphoribosyltransferase domain-containing protein n=1 Tax=Methylobacter sp. S3L5C TaxID=2839024 RepID=UPI001FAB4017|nr:phosphoribosyltransferase domain-containing protein [Methylobacter sp. S3L5C]UOA08713.1 phosphoribosyltransferase family protein [Methylobacter sp. S3L5C]